MDFTTSEKQAMLYILIDLSRVEDVIIDEERLSILNQIAEVLRMTKNDVEKSLNLELIDVVSSIYPMTQDKKVYLVSLMVRIININGGATINRKLMYNLMCEHCSLPKKDL